MSFFIIESGDNNAYKAIVDKDGLLNVKAFNQTLEQREVELGNSWNLNTGTINFGNSTQNAVFYVKNNEKEVLIVTAYIFLFGNSTGGSGDGLVQIIENPTGGTIQNATVGVPKNRNLGKGQKALNVDWRIGDGTKTSSGGSVIIESLFASPLNRKVVSVPTALPTGSSLSILYTPQSSNTSQNVQFAAAAYLSV